MEKDLKIRYARQIAIAEIGKEGQLKICSSKVLVIGCGALGSMVAMELAGAGIGTLGIADYDNIDISNLQRQYFFTTAESGKSKVETLSCRINDLNPEIKVNTYPFIVTAKRAKEIFAEYDFIVDATDNPDTKRLSGEITLQLGKPCCIGGVRDFEGQVMTFMPTDPRFEDYFGKATSDGILPCSLAGVIGPAAALCASIQACETIKYLSGTGKLLSGRILLFNLLDNTFKTFSI